MLVSVKVVRRTDRDLDLFGRALATKLYSFFTCWMIALSSSSPATRMDWAVTMPPGEMTATYVVPPPMSTTALPRGLVDRQAGADGAAMGS